jgi:predicted amidohydrolase YtcJ
MLIKSQNIHCIGDKANNVVLDIFEKMIYNNPNKDARPRIEHAQIMTQHDLQRIGRLGGECMIIKLFIFKLIDTYDKLSQVCSLLMRESQLALGLCTS